MSNNVSLLSADDIQDLRELGFTDEEIRVWAEDISKIYCGKTPHTTATYKFTPEHNGIEIHFNTKPETAVLDELKENGWRWHSVKRCWFAKRNSENEKFAKTFCDELPCLEIPENKEVLPIETEEIASFNYINSDQSIFSSVTITRKQQQYTVSSTNNQITCCDCNRWISIHATACPGCGCPQNYIIEYYFNKYNDKVIKEQQRAEEETKNQLINQIQQYFRYDVSEELHNLAISDIQIAYDRTIYLHSHRKELLSCSPDDFLTYHIDALFPLLICSESWYQDHIIKLRQEKIESNAKDKLIKSICHDAYNVDRLALRNLSLEELRVANERVQYIRCCKNLPQSCATFALITADESSYQEELEKARQRKKQEDAAKAKKESEEYFRKYDKLRYYQTHYPQYGLTTKDTHLSEDQIREIIRKLSNSR